MGKLARGGTGKLAQTKLATMATVAKSENGCVSASLVLISTASGCSLFWILLLPRSRPAAFNVRPSIFTILNTNKSQSTYLFVFWLLQGSLSLRLCPSSCHNWHCKRSEAQQKQVKSRQGCKPQIPSSRLEHKRCRPKISEQRDASFKPKAPGWNVGWTRCLQGPSAARSE